MTEKIKLSGVPETMLQTLYARAKESKGRGVIHDEKAEEIADRLDYDFSLADKDTAMQSGVIARTIYDVIFVAVRYTQTQSVTDALRANKTKNIIFVGNNVRTSPLSASLPDKNVMFAFAVSAGHRDADKAVSVDLHRITVGPSCGAPDCRELTDRIFAGTKYKVIYEPNMEDYLLCHAAFVIPSVFACYKTGGNLKKLRKNNTYLNRLIDANIEGYRAIRNAWHEILPSEDKDFESSAYRKTCFRFFKLMCATSLGKICASDHALNAVDEMRAPDRDLKEFFDENGAEYPVWKELEKDTGGYLK